MNEHYDGLPAYLTAYIFHFGKWLLMAAATGTICGLIGSLFSLGVAWANTFRAGHPYLLYALPAAGLFIVWFYRFLEQEMSSTDTIIEAARDGGRLDIRQLPAIFIGTVLTHLFGGSAGREGAALQIGGDIGNFLGSLLKRDDNDLKTLTLCGMAGFFAAVFGTPLTAAIFVVLFLTAGAFVETAILPCFVSSLVAYGIAGVFGAERFHFPVNIPALAWHTYLRIALLAALTGLLSVVFVEILHRTAYAMRIYIKNVYLRVLVGGAIVVILTLLLGTTDYNGAGSAVIERAVTEGVVRPEAFFLKMIFTAITLAAGYKGGEIVPTFFVGATFGALAAPLLGLPAAFGAAIGLVAMFAGATNTLIPSLFLAIEVFGGAGIPAFALAVMISYTVSGYNGLYSSQKILYSKVRPQRIDLWTNEHLH